MSGRRLHVDGVSLSVEEAGSGPPLVMLHGFTGSARTLADTARRLAGFRTLRVDLLGHGSSEAPREVGPYTMERCARQIAGVIDALAGGAAHVLGYSMGGRAALAVACLHPDRVRSAVLVGARAGFADPEERRARVAADEALARSIERDGLEAFVDRWMALPLFASQARLGPTFLAEARRQRLANRVHGLTGSLRGMGAGAQPPFFDRLASLAVPVLVVVGQEDPRFAAVARDLTARIPEARLACVPEAGHAAHLESPDAFARIVRRFLADVAACPSASTPSHMEEPCRTSTGRA